MANVNEESMGGGLRVAKDWDGIEAWLPLIMEVTLLFGVGGGGLMFVIGTALGVGVVGIG